MVHLATHLLLAKAHMRVGSNEAALLVIDWLLGAMQRHPRAQAFKTSPFRYETIKTLARVCKELGDKASLVRAVQATHSLLQDEVFRQDVFEQAENHEFVASVHVLMCECAHVDELAPPTTTPAVTHYASSSSATVDGPRCACGAVLHARDAMQRAVDASTAMQANKGAGGKRKLHKRREHALQLLRDQLGEQADPAELERIQLQAEKREKLRLHNQRRRARFASCMDGVLDTLQPQVWARLHAIDNLCAPDRAADDTPKARMLWSSVPESLHPVFGNDKAASRGEKKRWQLESIFKVLHCAVRHLEQRGPKKNTHTMDTTDATTTAAAAAHTALQAATATATAATTSAETTPIRIVDFGSGSGNSVLAHASLLPHCQFVLVDMNAKSVEIGKERTKAAGVSVIAPLPPPIYLIYIKPVPKILI